MDKKIKTFNVNILGGMYGIKSKLQIKLCTKTYTEVCNAFEANLINNSLSNELALKIL